MVKVGFLIMCILEFGFFKAIYVYGNGRSLYFRFRAKPKKGARAAAAAES
jgi:hypothetical protein